MFPSMRKNTIRTIIKRTSLDLY